MSESAIEPMTDCYAFKELETALVWYHKRAHYARDRYHYSEILLLIAGASIPVSAAFASPRWLAAVLGGLVVVLAGLRSLYGWREDWLRFTIASSQLEGERLYYLDKTGLYSDENRDAILARRFEEVKMAETRSWAAFRQKAQPTEHPYPADVDHSSPTSHLPSAEHITIGQ